MLRGPFLCSLFVPVRKAKKKYALKDAQTLVISKQVNAPCFWNIINSLKTIKACNIPIGVYING